MKLKWWCQWLVNVVTIQCGQASGGRCCLRSNLHSSAVFKNLNHRSDLSEMITFKETLHKIQCSVQRVDVQTSCVHRCPQKMKIIIIIITFFSGADLLSWTVMVVVTTVTSLNTLMLGTNGPWVLRLRGWVTSTLWCHQEALTGPSRLVEETGETVVKISCDIMTNIVTSWDQSRSIRCNWGQFPTLEMGQYSPRQSSSPSLFSLVSFLHLTQSSSSSSSLSAPLLFMPRIITLSNLIIIRFTLICFF